MALEWKARSPPMTYTPRWICPAVTVGIPRKTCGFTFQPSRNKGPIHQHIKNLSISVHVETFQEFHISVQLKDVSWRHCYHQLTKDCSISPCLVVRVPRMRRGLVYLSMQSSSTLLEGFSFYTNPRSFWHPSIRYCNTPLVSNMKKFRFGSLRLMQKHGKLHR